MEVFNFKPWPLYLPRRTPISKDRRLVELDVLRKPPEPIDIRTRGRSARNLVAIPPTSLKTPQQLLTISNITVVKFGSTNYNTTHHTSIYCPDAKHKLSSDTRNGLKAMTTRSARSKIPHVPHTKHSNTKCVN
jgi:hypothetical protein